jgi:hypothetical protein
MHPALGFLALLDPAPEATFNIETYTDARKGVPKPQPDPLCRRFANRSLTDVELLLPQLQVLNDQGAAVYVTVNECDGQRSSENVSRIRGVHADMDEAPETVLEAVRSRLMPTIEVQTSGPGNRHFYWLLKQGEVMSADVARRINRGLVELGADRAATDVSRLLRLPGFRNMKHADRGLANDRG